MTSPQEDTFMLFLMQSKYISRTLEHASSIYVSAFKESLLFRVASKTCIGLHLSKAKRLKCLPVATVVLIIELTFLNICSEVWSSIAFSLARSAEESTPSTFCWLLCNNRLNL